MAAIWVEDEADQPLRKTAHSRGEIEKIFADEHAQMFKGSTYKSGEMKVQWVTPDVAVVDLEGTISGLHGSDGAGARIIRITSRGLRQEGWQMDGRRRTGI